jgi:hypothetical protein
MVAIEAACSKTGERHLNGCDLYTTLEPGPMCAAAIYSIRSDLTKSPQERIIPYFSCDAPEAVKIIEEWSEAGSNPDQKERCPR